MLGNRLELCFNMIEKGMTVCDVGTDHGYLACELVKINLVGLKNDQYMREKSK